VIDPCNWQGEATPENIEEVREVLRLRMPTYHFAISAHELFCHNDLNEGNYVAFSPEQIALTLVYGLVMKERKSVVIPCLAK
jgi:hypothetical protein